MQLPQKINSGQAEYIAFISDFYIQSGQLINRLSSRPIMVDRASPSTFSQSSNEISLTFKKLGQHSIHSSLIECASKGGVLLIIYEAARNQTQALQIATQL
ncbi:hypothetical protein GHO25_02820 [Pseudomonas sp. FSL R10-1350]|uniref:hypothetical protein n=1 Tax=Pseudomonas sp. FSL R10-1350 TaxID=2662197 RepID=UPI00129505E2|nr:hypothetical protein [Pseudomonas sp. FSL R10-1350]MQU62063.1 hypothetical protein [Pseudomonas sp. FSL R10-1350]